MDMGNQAVAGRRRQAIAEVIGEELRRQALSGARRVDIDAMAGAIEDVIADDDAAPPVIDEDGKEPDELNASNDG